MSKSPPKKRTASASGDSSLRTYISQAPELFRALKDHDVIGLARFMEEPHVAIAEGVTALLKQGLSALPTAGAIATRIVQGCLQGRFYQQLGQEIEDLREQGKIAPDPSSKPCGWESWRELLDAIDQDPMDDEKFEALKAMFYDINRVTSKDRDCILSYQLMRLARKLSAGELLLLKAAYLATKNGERGHEPHWEGWKTWASRVNNHYGQGPFALIRLNEKNLVEHELLTSRHPSDVNQVTIEDNRLTDLGMRFCKNIEGYRQSKEVE
jgi:hypothetical protein